MAIPKELKNTINNVKKEYHNDPLLFAHLADLMIQIGDHPKAVEILTEGTKRYPRYATGWLILGGLYLNQSRWEEAYSVFTRVLVIEPANIHAQTQYAAIALKLKKRDEQILHLREASRLDPLNEEIAKLLETAILRKAALDGKLYGEDRLESIMPDALRRKLIEKGALPEELSHLNKTISTTSQKPSTAAPAATRKETPKEDSPLQFTVVTPHFVQPVVLPVVKPPVVEPPVVVPVIEPPVVFNAQDPLLNDEFKRMVEEISVTQQIEQEWDDFVRAIPPESELEPPIPATVATEENIQTADGSPEVIPEPPEMVVEPAVIAAPEPSPDVEPSPIAESATLPEELTIPDVTGYEIPEQPRVSLPPADLSESTFLAEMTRMAVEGNGVERSQPPRQRRILRDRRAPVPVDIEPTPAVESLLPTVTESQVVSEDQTIEPPQPDIDPQPDVEWNSYIRAKLVASGDVTAEEANDTDVVPVALPAVVETPPERIATKTLAELYASQKDWQKAIEIYEELVRLHPDNYKYIARLKELRLKYS